jgi:hypothetical protein
MKTWDYAKFEKKVKEFGYSIGKATKHHTLLNPEGEALLVFAVNHKKGGRRQ